ncbi:Pheromone/general odorant binding protein [Cinara cedri]|uniref:Pheromone/general odorant binding protein n=1 Tax=Cinara cedri TaxID=506608 RepID=A0A5E4NAQ5_9HEMI|nr:Pheromone/general odorant binding protein [Cinara cedri]
MALWKLQVSVLWCGLALLCSSFVNGKYSAEDVDLFGNLCNATKEDMDVVKNYDVPSTETGKCFMKCLCEKSGMLDSYGKYSRTGTKEVLTKYWPETPVNIITKVNDACYMESLKISPTELGTCNYYYKVKKCLNTQYKRYGML